MVMHSSIPSSRHMMESAPSTSLNSTSRLPEISDVLCDQNSVVPQSTWTEGPWFEIHRNFASYVLQKISPNLKPELLRLSNRWAQWDMLTCLANYHCVIKILLGYLEDQDFPDSNGVATHVAVRLSLDMPLVLGQMTSILHHPETYKDFLASRGSLAQELLDLVQDLLDSAFDPSSNPVLSKALLRLSRTCGLHPTCFALSGLQKVGHQLAAGGYGDVWKGLVGGQTVAIKSMRIFLKTDAKAALKEFGHEAIIWRQLSHPNLLPFFGLYTLDDRLCLVSPWMESGDLQQFLTSAPPNIDHLSLILDVAMGIGHLHKNHIVHGDLKAPNVLVTPSGRACISDFGLCSIDDAMSLKFTHSTRMIHGGTARYQAPELLTGASLNHFGSDVYAFALVGYEILTRHPPFFELPNEMAVSIKVIAGHRPFRPQIISSDVLWALFENCWQQKQANRPTMFQTGMKHTVPNFAVLFSSGR
ncbi:kinase-like domain-containing protein [Mycena galericulata]|nr:kinase-like domain-containing protein [Mycena galericulata]